MKAKARKAEIESSYTEEYYNPVFQALVEGEDLTPSDDIRKTAEKVEDVSNVIEESGGVVEAVKKKWAGFTDEAGKLGKALGGLLTKVGPYIGVTAALAAAAGLTYLAFNSSRIEAEKATKAYEK
jgi:hypothetical protein